MTIYVGHSSCENGFECEECKQETPCDRMYEDCMSGHICELCAESHDSSCEECYERCITRHPSTVGVPDA